MSDGIIYFLTGIFTPIILVIVCVIMWKNPSAYGSSIGYRTVRSQKSNAAWDLAQVSFGKIGTICSAVSIALTAAGLVPLIFLELSEDLMLAVFLAVTFIQVALIVIPIALTEKKLKKYFG